jgi:2-polyprenyl-3-methyl-5-hydroxy-6-metoxy-1,4-benzoquinol methylase
VTTELRESCPCCAGKDLSEIGRLPDSQWFAGTRLEQPLPGGWLYRCHNCSLKFRNPAQTAEKYAKLYDNVATTTWSANTFRPDWDLVARHIARQLPHGGSVLDFGCYTGGLLSRLGAQYQRNGVEVNRAAANVASQNIGSNVWSSIDEIPDELRFDVVIAADVIEHVTNPLLLVEQFTSKLSEDGVLILTTGDADNFLWNRFGANWWYCYYPEHIVFISKDWLQYISKAAGVVVVRCEFFRYFKFSLLGRIVNWMLTYFYGVFPTAFLGLVRLFRKMLGRQKSTSIPGAGISRDHLFVVLSRSAKS